MKHKFEIMLYGIVSFVVRGERLSSGKFLKVNLINEFEIPYATRYFLKHWLMLYYSGTCSVIENSVKYLCKVERT